MIAGARPRGPGTERKVSPPPALASVVAMVRSVAVISVILRLVALVGADLMVVVGSCLLWRGNEVDRPPTLWPGVAALPTRENQANRD